MLLFYTPDAKAVLVVVALFFVRFFDKQFVKFLL